MPHFTKPATGSWTKTYPDLGTEPVGYTDSIDPEFYEDERNAIFKRSWLNVGRVERLPRTGSYFTRELTCIGTAPIIVKDTDATIRAFRNVCRHRGNKLAWDDYPNKNLWHLLQIHQQIPHLALQPRRRSQFVQQEQEFFDLDKQLWGLLAERLCTDYAEADSFHSRANIARMASGSPLTDADRMPWLHAIAEWISGHTHSGGVVSSSALKRRYRDVLRSGGDVWFLHIYGSRDLIAARMARRTDHFMPVSLLNTQFADLEPLMADENGLTVDVAETPEQIVEAAVRRLRDLGTTGAESRERRAGQ